MPKRTALIVPCYNEEKRLRGQQFLEFVSGVENIDLWFIDDGSRDSTFQIIGQIAGQSPSRVFTERLPVNSGKAEAIRTGCQAALATGRYDYVGYIDADLSAPLPEVVPLNELINEGRYLIVAGCRIKMAGRKIERTLIRHYISRIFATYYSQLLGVHNYDTQCGLKLFAGPFAARLFDSPFVSRWLFDLELFLRAKKLLGEEEYAGKVIESPLYEWQEIGGSKLKWHDFVKAPLEVLRIYFRYRGPERGGA